MLEATRERERLRRLAPHLVRPMRFVYPIYADGPVSKWKLAAGLWAYDLLAGIRSVHRHRMLGAAAVGRNEPGLRTDGLRGAGVYWDCWTDDARLVLETLLSARDAGAVAVSYARVIGFVKEAGRVVGRPADGQSGRPRGDGPGARGRQRRGTVGGRRQRHGRAGAAAAPSHQGRAHRRPAHPRRPRGGDRAARGAGRARDVRDPVGRVLARRDDGYRSPGGRRGAAYRRARGRRVPARHGEPLLPGCEADAGRRGERVRRPAAAGGAAEDGSGESPSDVSREEEIFTSRSGADHHRRRQAHHLPADRRRGGRPGREAPRARPSTDCRSGARGPPTCRFPAARRRRRPWPPRRPRRTGTGWRATSSTISPVGTAGASTAVLGEVAKDRALGAPVLPAQPDPRAEVVAAVEGELAMTLEDVLRRRTQLALFDPAGGTAAADEVAALMARAARLEPRRRPRGGAGLRGGGAGGSAAVALNVARESRKARATRARAIARGLAKAYPDAWCELDYRSPWELVIATILSAQCTDKMVNQVTPALFAAFPTPDALAARRPGTGRGADQADGLLPPEDASPSRRWPAPSRGARGQGAGHHGGAHGAARHRAQDRERGPRARPSASRPSSSTRT